MWSRYAPKAFNKLCKEQEEQPFIQDVECAGNVHHSSWFTLCFHHVWWVSGERDVSVMVHFLCYQNKCHISSRQIDILALYFRLKLVSKITLTLKNLELLLNMDLIDHWLVNAICAPTMFVAQKLAKHSGWRETVLLWVRLLFFSF